MDEDKDEPATIDPMAGDAPSGDPASNHGPEHHTPLGSGGGADQTPHAKQMLSMQHKMVIKPLIDDVSKAQQPPAKPAPLPPQPLGADQTPLPKEPEAADPSDPAAPVEDKRAGQKQEVIPIKRKKKTFGHINRDTAEYIIDSLSMLLLAGVTVGEAIESIAGEITNKGSHDAMLAMRDNIDEGVPFAKALAETGLFNPSIITLIEVGESTGKLPENLRVVAAQMHKNNVMNAKIKSAMLYPAFLVTLLFIVGTGIGVFLLPKLLNIIEGLQVKVGPITKLLIVFGTWFGKYGLIAAAGIVVMVIATSIAIKKVTFVKNATQELLFHVPGIKKLLFETEIARFGFILGTLLDAGLPVVTALQSLAASMSTRRYALFATEMQGRVDNGDSFEKILSDKKYHKLLPGTISQIVVSAEKSGNLSSSLLKVGQNYEDKADLTAHNLETLLEPIVLVLIAVAVLFVAMAVFLPIYSLVGNLNGNK